MGARDDRAATRRIRICLFLGFPFHRWRGGVLALDPVRRAPRAVGQVLRFDTMPSRPILQACANTSG